MTELTELTRAGVAAATPACAAEEEAAALLDGGERGDALEHGCGPEPNPSSPLLRAWRRVRRVAREEPLLCQTLAGAG